MEVTPTLEKTISKIQNLEVEPHTKLVGEDIRTTKPKVNIEPLVFVQLEINEL